MISDNKHLIFDKEELITERRGKRRNFTSFERENPGPHALSLLTRLQDTKNQVSCQEGAKDGSYIFKLTFADGFWDFDNMQSIGVEVVSQEDNEVCVVSASEDAVEKFTNDLDTLQVDPTKVTERQLLEALDDISGWTPDDRKSWCIKNYGLPQEECFYLDVELWVLGEGDSSEEREVLKDEFESWLVSHCIQKIDDLNIDGLLMFRVRVNCKQADLLLNHVSVRMVDLPPKSGIHPCSLNLDLGKLEIHKDSLSHDAPRVCILDSGISTNHPLLEFSIGESAVYTGEADASDQKGHGTYVASIALYGDLEECQNLNHWRPACWIFNAKVLNDNGEYSDELMESALVKAVGYFAEQGCRIFNVSFGNVNAPFDNKHIGRIAYTIDVLSRKHKVLFVISAGNFLNENDILEKGWRAEYPDYLLGDATYIIDPATALNGITVGSVVKHEATSDNQLRPHQISHLPVAKTDQPSPFTRHGPSINGAIKPDLVQYGGNLALNIKKADQSNFVQNSPGVMVANSKFMITHNPLITALGTSFSAPYVTHLAARILSDYPNISVNAVRALLANHADIPDRCYQTFSKDMTEASYKECQPQCINVVGYGMVNEENLFRSDDDAVTLIAEDTIKNDKNAFYELPLPNNFLEGRARSRDIRVSLSYMPAVRRSRMAYKATKISFRLVSGTSLEEVQKSFNKKYKPKNSEKLKEFDRKRFISYLDRSKGTLQFSKWRFKQSFRNKEKFFIVVTRQDQYGWGGEMSAENEEYALVVTVRDKESQDNNLYALISNKIELKNKERMKTKVRVGS